MPRPPCLALCLPALAALALSPSIASGQAPPSPTDDESPSPFETGHFRAELAGGVGFSKSRTATGESVNAYGATASARVGYTFAFPIYLGLRYDHFFGASAQYPLPLVALTTYHLGASFLGLAAGAEIRVGPAYLRPQIGLGALALRSRASCSPVAGSFSDLADQICAANSHASTTWAPSVVPGLPMGLQLGRFYGFVEPDYYFRKTAAGYALVGGIGLAF